MGFALRLPLFVSIPLLCFALFSTAGAQTAAPGGIIASPDRQAPESMDLAAGERLASETVLAAELADVIGDAQGLRLRTVLGDAGRGNLDDLINGRSADFALVATDALAEAAANGHQAKLKLVAKLPPQHIHVLASADISDISALAGKRVNFGPAGSGNALAAARLFETLGIQIEPVSLEGARGLAQLARGTIEAIVVVGAKPSPLLSEIAASSGLHLLPIPFAAALQDDYLPASVDHHDYPHLIAEQNRVASVATGLVLLARADQEAKLARFVEAVSSRLAALQEDDRHPQWRDINLAATLPGWERAASAGTGPQAQPKPNENDGWQPITAGASGPASLSRGDDTESLFEGFMEWQRERALAR